MPFNFLSERRTALRIPEQAVFVLAVGVRDGVTTRNRFSGWNKRRKLRAKPPRSGSGPSPFMINFRVDNRRELLKALREEGVQVDDKVEEHDYGKFGWITDPEGNRVELWEPPKNG